MKGSPQFGHQRLQKLEPREAIPRPLDKQHRQPDTAKMVGAPGARPARRVERKPQKHQALDARQRRLRGRRRGHAPAEGLTAGHDAQTRRLGPGRLHRLPHGFLEHRRRIGGAAALLHVGELIAEAGNLPPGQILGHRPQERVAHSCSRAMGHDIQKASVAGSGEKGAHPLSLRRHGERQLPDRRRHPIPRRVDSHPALTPAR